MSAGAVLTYLQAHHVGQQYVWQAAGGGPIHHWLTTTTTAPMPGIAGGMCCFHLPLVAAIQSGNLTKDQAGNLIVDQMMSGINNTFPASWAPAGIQRYYFGNILGCLPIRTVQEALGGAPNPMAGDLVFFSTNTLKWFAHVAVATGIGAGTISFGHGAGLGGGVALRVETRSIYQILNDFNNQMTQVHFGTPPW